MVGELVNWTLYIGLTHMGITVMGIFGGDDAYTTFSAPIPDLPSVYAFGQS